MNERFFSLADVEKAMDEAMRKAEHAKAHGDAIKELQHTATAWRLCDLRNAVDAYGDEIILPDEAFENR